MDQEQHDDRPLGPVEFMNRAALIVAVVLATILILSLDRVAP
jgi:hypothetical protein